MKLTLKKTIASILKNGAQSCFIRRIGGVQNKVWANDMLAFHPVDVGDLVAVESREIDGLSGLFSQEFHLLGDYLETVAQIGLFSGK